METNLSFSKSNIVIYWISTIFVVLAAVATGIQNVIYTPQMQEIFQNLSLPAYLSPFLGVVKILGAIALLFPVGQKLRKMAYHGFIFFFIGASFVNFGGGQAASAVVTLVILALIFVSFIWAKKIQKV